MDLSNLINFTEFLHSSMHLREYVAHQRKTGQVSIYGSIKTRQYWITETGAFLWSVSLAWPHPIPQDSLREHCMLKLGLKMKLFYVCSCSYSICKFDKVLFLCNPCDKFLAAELAEIIKLPYVSELNPHYVASTHSNYTYLLQCLGIILMLFLHIKPHPHFYTVSLA